MKRHLTDRTLKTLKRAPPGKRYMVMDDEVRGLGVRVNDKGKVAFIFQGRFGSNNPTRRHLGDYSREDGSGMSLADARKQARKWRDLIAEGKDPRSEQERRRQAELRRQAVTFSVVADAYFADIKRRGLRRAAEVEREIRREFLSLWANRPIADIDWFDVKAVIDAAKNRGVPWQAHHLFSYAQRLFSWAREQGTYGIAVSPLDGRRPSKT